MSSFLIQQCKDCGDYYGVVEDGDLERRGCFGCRDTVYVLRGPSSGDSVRILLGVYTSIGNAKRAAEDFSDFPIDQWIESKDGDTHIANMPDGYDFVIHSITVDDAP